jgi:hypothetical protein
MNSQKIADLKEMKLKVEQIEKLACELKDIGQGIPFVEQNVQSFLNTVYILKFGISDVAEIDTV